MLPTVSISLSILHDCPTGLSKGGTQGVTGNESGVEDHEADTDRLKDAAPLDLATFAATPSAMALVDAVMPSAIAQDTLGRKTKRGTQSLTKLREAATAIVGGALRIWLRDGRMTFQTHHAEAFTGEAVAHRQYVAAEAALVAAGWIECVPGIAFEVGFGAFERKAARIRLSATLVDLAAALGITGENVRDHFGIRILSTPPRMAGDIVQLRPLNPKPGQLAIPSVRIGAVAGARLGADVKAMNEAAGCHTFVGCRPPRWYRIFSGDLALGGRWFVPGSGGNYLTMPKASRAAIEIDGLATVTLDIRAAHLSILLGLTGQGIPEGDLYAVGGDIPRDVVKHWIMLALGSGRMRTKWSKATSEAIRAFRAVDVGKAVADRHPIFRGLDGPEVSKALGLDRLGALGKPSDLLTHRLQNIEAKALTQALGALLQEGILALPIHDAVLVQVVHEQAARAALGAACVAQFGVAPAIT